MLFSCDVQKILICAPSNAAVDEVVSRLSINGLLGSSEEVEGNLLRVGALDYEPSAAVLCHTLDERVAKYQAESAKKKDDKYVERLLIKDARILCCTLSVAG